MIAKLGGVPLSSVESVRWSLREGTEPVQETFVVPNRDDFVNAFESAQRGTAPITLQLDGTTFQNLYVTNILPGSDPGDRKIEVSDVRYWWRYPLIVRDFNITRRVGFRRRGKWNEDLQQDVQPDLIYARYSLENPFTKKSDSWTAKNALKSILDEIKTYLRSERGIQMRFGIGSMSSLDALPMEDITIADPGNAAIGRILGFLPGVGIYQDYDGTIRTYNKTGGGEEIEIAKLGPEVAEQGHIEVVTNEAVRPQAIEIFFTPEVELRFDFEEPESTDTRQTESTTEGAMSADNVIPVPDFEITIDGNTIPQGTYVRMSDYLDAIGDPPGTLTQIDYDTLRRAMVPEMSLWNALYIVGQLDVDAGDADWAARVAAIQTHWRTTFRINRIWMDHIRSLQPYLVATIDPVSGQRSPAMVFSDHFVHASQKSLFRGALTGKDELSYGFNVPGYPDGPISATTRPAPARLQIMDEDQGIIHVSYQVDPYRMSDAVLPGLMASDKNPRPSLSKFNRAPVTFDSVGADGKVPELATGHKQAMLFTATPAGPNNNARMYKKRVTPQDVGKFLKNAGLGGLAGRVFNFSAFGPTMQIHVSPNTETARFAWDDNVGDLPYQQFFGLVPGIGNLQNQLVNAQPDGQVRGQAVQGASIDRMALAIGAQVYSGFIDHLGGSAAGRGNKNIRPNGFLSEVVHNVFGEGAYLTSADMPEQPDGFDMMSFLDSGTRRLLMKLAQTP